MLYLESPAGSGESSGFSTCISGGKAVACEWNDVNQGEAYAHTLQAFFKAFPEYGNNDLYLTGESYFGQYGISEPMRCLQGIAALYLNRLSHSIIFPVFMQDPTSLISS